MNLVGWLVGSQSVSNFLTYTLLLSMFLCKVANWCRGDESHISPIQCHPKVLGLIFLKIEET